MYTHVHLEKAFTSCEEAKDESLSHVDGPEIQRATAFTQMGVRVVSILRGGREEGGRRGGGREGEGEGGGGEGGGGGEERGREERGGEGGREEEIIVLISSLIWTAEIGTSR